MENHSKRAVPPIKTPPPLPGGLKLNVNGLLRDSPRDIRKALVMALVVSRGRVVEIGYNRLRFRAETRFSIHAEEAALKKAGRRAQGAVMYILRVKKDGSWGMAKPCPRCELLIRKRGIARWDWSTEEWNKTEMIDGSITYI